MPENTQSQALEPSWNEVSQGVREHFLTCAANPDATAEVDGLGPVPIRTRRVELDLRDRQAPYDWSQLDRLGALLSLEVTGPAPGLPAYLASRALIRRLVWRRPEPQDLDLAGAGLEALELELGDDVPRTLRIDDQLDELGMLTAETDLLTVEKAR